MIFNFEKALSAPAEVTGIVNRILSAMFILGNELQDVLRISRT